jgi:UDP:flavonoid glycosyltransferase YjiC (YdhE family)
MKIGIQTWGSRGDIRPFIALAEGLQVAGHDVTLVITCADSARYNDYVSAKAVKMKTVASPVIKDTDDLTKVGDKIISSNNNPLKQLMFIMKQFFLPAEKKMYASAEILCRENDLVIGHYVHYPLQIAAEIYNVPYINVMLAHFGIPTQYEPPHGMPNLGKWANKIFWRLMGVVLNLALKSHIDKLRVEHGLKPCNDVFTDIWTSQKLNLVAVSNTLCPRQIDWPDSYQICGFLDMEKIENEKIPDDLEIFLKSGGAPVYMNFGSFTPAEVNAQKKLIELFVEAAQMAKCRAIIQAPLWQECEMKNSSEIFFVKEASHDAVFPRCLAIVHHGGAGTTQSAALAGIPSIIVYHISEQEFWGRRLERLGLTTGIISRKKTTAKKIGERIKLVIESPAIIEKAKEVGALMRKENGVKNAVAIIEARYGK